MKDSPKQHKSEIRSRANGDLSKTKLSHCKGSPHQASILFTQILFQPPQYKRKTSRTVLPIISPGCCTISVGQTPYPRQWGAQVQWQASRIFASLQKSPLTPLPKGFCGEALPHEDLSAIPRSNPLKEDTLLTGYGWGVSSATPKRDKANLRPIVNRSCETGQ